MSTPAPATGVLWDTMFASRLRPSRSGLLEAALASRGSASEPLLAVPVVAEVVFGLRRRAAADASYAELARWWERHVLTGPEPFRVVVPAVAAVVLAARVRARLPASPAKTRRTDGREDPERRVSWARDIELAAIGATSGLAVATANLRRFMTIATLIAETAPQLTLELRDSVGAGQEGLSE